MYLVNGDGVFHFYQVAIKLCIFSSVGLAFWSEGTTVLPARAFMQFVWLFD